MKTITFYSYKGGVGRSLALSNIANRLAEIGKNVCVLDFDLEAPGIQFKFNNFSHDSISKGIVDYIYQFSNEGTIPSNISEFSLLLNPKTKQTQIKPIRFIPAGNIDNGQYWEKLSRINWYKLFYSPNSEGVSFFLDLKTKIQKEFSPDFLLIDSRTGITDISGISLRLMADEVVILAANNEENLYGSLKIIKNLTNKENSIFNKPIKINFILTRLPFTDTKIDREKEKSIIEKWKRKFEKNVKDFQIEILLIHSDRRLEENESLLIGDFYVDKGINISNDYLRLFEVLTEDNLNPEEINNYTIKRIAENKYIKATQSDIDINAKLSLLEEAANINPINAKYQIELGDTYFKSRHYEMAIQSYNTALIINPQNEYILSKLAEVYITKKDYVIAQKYIDELTSLNRKNVNAHLMQLYLLVARKKFIKNNLTESEKLNGLYTEIIEFTDKVIELDPSQSIAYNTRANYNRLLGKYDDAFKDIYKAIELDSEKAVYYGTLAEINYSINQKEEFYFYITLALKKGITANILATAIDVYIELKDDKRFNDLLNSYNIEFNEILNASD